MIKDYLRSVQLAGRSLIEIAVFIVGGVFFLVIEAIWEFTYRSVPTFSSPPRDLLFKSLALIWIGLGCGGLILGIRKLVIRPHSSVITLWTYEFLSRTALVMSIFLLLSGVFGIKLAIDRGL